jgi:hypothetical protein
MPPKTTDDSVPITTGTIVRWASVIALIVGAIVSAVSYAVMLRGDVTSTRDTITRIEAQGTPLAREIGTKVAIHDNDINELKRKGDTFEQRLNEMDKKLDSSIVILKRIDEKVGKP